MARSSVAPACLSGALEAGAVTIHRTFHCDGPECVRQVSENAHREPGGRMLTMTGWTPAALHFCTWDCVLRYAAPIPPETIIPCGPPEDDE